MNLLIVISLWATQSVDGHSEKDKNGFSHHHHRQKSQLSFWGSQLWRRFIVTHTFIVLRHPYPWIRTHITHTHTHPCHRLGHASPNLVKVSFFVSNVIANTCAYHRRKSWHERRTYISQTSNMCSHLLGPVSQTIRINSTSAMSYLSALQFRHVRRLHAKFLGA